jgi:hypothetical protein
MAKLSKFTINSKALLDGEWVSPGEEYDDLMLYLRGFTDAYADARNTRMRKVAMAFGGREDRIPTERSRDILVDCLDKFVVLDVKNLQHDDGKDVTRDEFIGLLRTPAGAELLVATINAASRVGRVAAEAVDDAAGK